jgi:hypothetical protein
MRAFVLVLLVIGLCPVPALCEEEAAEAPKPVPYAMGATVKDFSGPGLDGGKAGLADLTITAEKAEKAVLAAAKEFAAGKPVTIETRFEAIEGVLDDGEVDDFEKAALVGEAGRAFGLVASDDRLETLETLADVKAWIVSAKDAPMAIVLWASACDTSTSYYNEKMNELVAEENIRMLVVASHPYDEAKLIRERLEGFPFYWRVVLDQDQSIMKRFLEGGTRTPHVFVLDKAKALRYSGAVDSDPTLANDDEELEPYVRNAVRAIREGREVKVKQTKAKGCPLAPKKKGS